MLTKKQNQLLNYLIKSIESDGITPSYDELCEKLSLKSKSGIHRIVNGLEERGYIKRLENKIILLDYRLNYMTAISLEPRIFPELAVIDKYGLIYIC